MYLYESHLGGLYITECQQTYDELYCEECGDSDRELGEFETLEEFWNLIRDDVSVGGSGGWSLQYILPLVDAWSDYPFDIEYESLDDKENGYCCNSDSDVIRQIEGLLRKKGCKE